MTDRGLVSAIIIFLNAGQFLEEAIESVFAQVYTQWELLLVDDGSSDVSTELARRWAEEHPERVRYLEHPNHQNRGMSASRNLGLRLARGDYVGFLDADDVWLPHKLTRQMAILKLHPEAGMVYGSTQLWHSWTGDRNDAKHDKLQPIGVPPDTVVAPPALLVRHLLQQAITPAPSDALMRRETVDAVGGFEEKFRGIYEDQVFFAKVCLAAPVFVSSECWDRHRQHANSACALGRRTGEYYSAELALMFLHWLENYLLRRGYKGSNVWKSLQRAFLPYRHPILFRALKFFRATRERFEAYAKQVACAALPVSTRDWLRARLHDQ